MVPFHGRIFVNLTPSVPKTYTTFKFDMVPARVRQKVINEYVADEDYFILIKY